VQTALAGTVKHEVNCQPIENEEYRRVMAARTREAMRPKKQTGFIGGLGATMSGGNILAPGTLGGSGGFNSFIVSILLTCLA
jgi:transcription initiation factor TFIIF subunit beta